MIRRVMLMSPTAAPTPSGGVRHPARALAAEFPGAVFGWGPPPHDAVVVCASDWLDEGADLFAFDARFAEAETVYFDVAPRLLLEVARQVLTRYQRLIPRRNALSCNERFNRALTRHLSLHDLGKPLVRADHDHALDTWQWVLRLEPDAGVAVQLAALFHDVERLASEADERTEHRASDYQAFKDAHARWGAALVRAALSPLPFEPPIIERVAWLVEHHERPGCGTPPDGVCADPELSLLNDADALSFFSLNAWGFVHYYGAAHTAMKVRYTLARMQAPARGRLAGLRHHPEIARQLTRCGVATDLNLERPGEQTR